MCSLANIFAFGFVVFLLWIAVNIGQGKVRLTDDIEIAEADEVSDNNVALNLILDKEGAVHKLHNAEAAVKREERIIGEELKSLETSVEAAMAKTKVAKKSSAARVEEAVLPVARKLSPTIKRKKYPVVWAEVYSEPGCKGDKAKVELGQSEAQCDHCWDACNKNFESKTKVSGKLQSVRVFVRGSNGEDPMDNVPMPKGWALSLNTLCAGSFAYSEEQITKHSIKNNIRSEDGCVDTGDAYTNLLTWTGLPDETQDYDPQSYRFIYSTESSTYFAYQTYANLLSFEKSGQQKEPATGYVRLLTAPEADDMSVEKGGVVPTFTASRDPYSRSYSPYNKADAIMKYMASPETPKEEVMVIIDPDNWLVSTVAHVAAKVKPGQVPPTTTTPPPRPV
jgi:hypothetical protein